MGCRAKSHPKTSFVRGLLEEIDLLLTDRYRFRHWPIRFAPILAGLSPIPPGAAVSADLFILIAMRTERVVIISTR